MRLVTIYSWLLINPIEQTSLSITEDLLEIHAYIHFSAKKA